MRRDLVLASLLFAFAVLAVPAVGSSCNCRTASVEKEVKEIVLDLMSLISWVPLVGEIADVLSIKIVFKSPTLSITDRYTCWPYPPCCPVFWDTSVSTKQQISYGREYLWEPFETASVSVQFVPDVSEKWGPELSVSEPTECHAWHKLEGSQFVGYIIIEGKIPYVDIAGGEKKELHYNRTCIYGDDPKQYEPCKLTTGPRVSAEPLALGIPFRGQEPATLRVLVTRTRGKLENVQVGLIGVPLGISVEDVKRTVLALPPGIEAVPALLVEFALSTDLSLSETGLTTLWPKVTVYAVDECGREDNVEVYLGSGNRPLIKLDEGKACGWGGPHDICFIIEIEDRDLNERFQGKWSQEGGEILAPIILDCSNYSGPCHTSFGVRFRPAPGVAERSFTLWVVDQFGLESNRVTWSNPTKKIPNVAPHILISPAQLIGKVGQTVQATVTATDSDGDEIILEQVAGPGSFTVVGGRGMASGTWTWTVSEYYARGPR